MGDARHQPPERGELFRLDQRVLGLPQIAQRRFGGILGLAHLLFAALALADIERNRDDVLDLAVGVEQRQLVHQPLPQIAGGIQILLLVESELPARRQHPLVVLVGLLRAIARHQVGGGAADGVRGLDPEDAGHVAVHQDIAELLVLDVDDRGHGVDHLLQQPPAFGDRILGALLVGDVAHRPFIADDLALFVAHGGGAVGEPENRAAALAHLIFELAHHAVALHQVLVFRARRRMHVDRLGDIADAADQVLRRIVSHHPRQRRIGVEQRAGRRRHINPVDRAFEQLAIAFLGEPLLGQRMDGCFARGIGVDKGAAEHFGGAGDIADLVVHVGGGDRRVLLARGQRADRGCDRRQRTHGAANHEQRRENPDQDAGRAEHDALPLGLGQRPREVARQHPPPPRAEFAQQFGHPSDQPALGAQHFLVERGDLALPSPKST